LHTLGDHIHPHGITSAAGKPNIQILPSNCTLHFLKLGKPARPVTFPKMLSNPEVKGQHSTDGKKRMKEKEPANIIVGKVV